MAYNKNTDYQAKINDAVSKGDYHSAAKYEQQRNEKISQTGDTKHQQTDKYSKYLNGGGSSGGSFGGSSGSSGSGGGSNGLWNKDVDYMALMQSAADSGDYISANVEAPHLHLSAWKNGKPIDPATMIPGF
ncbi:hypothetical protein [Agathobaculum sp.]|uniref:hypothetical protein n=1 Tax=Agathobaculum sp. TaxID=2048138 RepID=UPI002A7ECDB1|nr:hypothetical protein [Agathobaculum sp.]MDY3619324.1 hypothetical protein [Agathobaculum sp.]